jgi:hypothetical protein
MTATSGAIEVLTTVPRAIVTGSAAAIRVTKVQNASPRGMSTSGAGRTPSRICTLTGTTTLVTRITRIPDVTSAVRYALRLLDIHPRADVAASNASGHRTSPV